MSSDLANVIVESLWTGADESLDCRGESGRKRGIS